MNIKVLGDRVLFSEVAQTNSSTITVLSENKGVLTGKVHKIGSGVIHVQEDESILYKEQDVYPITYDGKKYLIIREYDIIAVI